MKYNDGIVETLESAKINHEAVNSLSDGQEYLILIDATNISFADLEARDFVAKSSREENSLIIKASVITKNYVGMVLGNIFTSIHKPLFPFKIFNTKDEAIKWLKKK